MVFPVVAKARLGNILPIEINLAAAGAVQAADQGEQGGFAAAGRPQDGVEFALFLRLSFYYRRNIPLA